MRTEHLSLLTLLAGIMGAAVAGCGSSEEAPNATGGTTGIAANVGGTKATSQAPTGGSGTRASSTPSAAEGGVSTGGSPAAGGAPATGGRPNTGGTTNKASTAKALGGGPGAGGAETGGAKASAGSAAGGTSNKGNSSAVPAGGGSVGTGGKTSVGTPAGGQPATGGSSAKATGGSTNTGPCTATASKTVSSNAKPTGPHKVVMETNSDIGCGTIYRPQDLGGSEKYPIFVWGEGACSRDGRSNEASMAEIASHGYFVIADGPPSGGNCPSIGMPNSNTDLKNMSKTLLSYVTWAIAEGEKSCSAYYGSIDTTKVAADGFSCGGLMAESTGGDPRITTWGITSSGISYGADKTFYATVHTPVKILEGGSGDVAYKNGVQDYNALSEQGVPIIFLSKNGAGHGGDLGNGTGDFNSVNLAWLNWQLKGDTGTTGKGALYGANCKYCNGGGWEYKSANIK